jgi:hypothetical protein
MTQSLYDVEVDVFQTRVYKRVTAKSLADAELTIQAMVEDDPKGLDQDTEFEVTENVIEHTIAYPSQSDTQDEAEGIIL